MMVIKTRFSFFFFLKRGEKKVTHGSYVIKKSNETNLLWQTRH